MERLSDELRERCEALRDNYERIEERIASAAERSGRKPEDIMLLAATKTVPVEVVNYGIELGIRTIGENKVQEFLSKEPALLPCERHFIGHLQTNKVRQLIGKVRMIQSVDSVHLAEEIDRVSKKLGCVTEVLLEVNIGREPNKSGADPAQVEQLVEELFGFSGIQVCGLMAIPPICENEAQIRGYFAKMNQLFIDMRTKKTDNSSIRYLSMGMSGDYEAAIMEGANIVRIGSALFGSRKYV